MITQTPGLPVTSNFDRRSHAEYRGETTFFISSIKLSTLHRFSFPISASFYQSVHLRLDYLDSTKITMLFLSVIRVSLLLLGTQHVRAFKVTTITPKPFVDRSPNIPSSNVVEMARRPGLTRSSKALHAIRKGQSNFGSTQITGTLEVRYSKHLPKSLY